MSYSTVYPGTDVHEASLSSFAQSCQSYHSRLSFVSINGFLFVTRFGNLKQNWRDLGCISSPNCRGWSEAQYAIGKQGTAAMDTMTHLFLEDLNLTGSRVCRKLNGIRFSKSTLWTLWVSALYVTLSLPNDLWLSMPDVIRSCLALKQCWVMCCDCITSLFSHSQLRLLNKALN